MASHQQIDRHLEYTGDFLERSDRALAPAILQIGDIALSDVRIMGEIELCDVLPFTDDSDRILAIGDPVDHVERDDYTALRDLLAGTRHQTRSTGVLVRLGS